MAGALALAAVFLIAVVEMVFSPGKNGCAMPVGMMESVESGHGNGNGNAEEVLVLGIGRERGVGNFLFILFWPLGRKEWKGRGKYDT